MSPVADHSKSRLATRLCFAAAGFGVACWAPLVSFAIASIATVERTEGLDLRIVH
jgi:hypothetical protein